MRFWTRIRGNLLLRKQVHFLRNTDWKRLAATVFIVSFGGYILWTTSHLVIAYQATKHAHIFPNAVNAEGWNEPNGALSQDLPGLAPFGSFSKSNSAYIELAASTSTEDQEPIPQIQLPQPPIQMPQGSAPTSTPPAGGSGQATTTSTTTPAVPAPATTTLMILPEPQIVSSTSSVFNLRQRVLEDLAASSTASSTPSEEIENDAPTSTPTSPAEQNPDESATTTQQLPLPVIISPQQSATTSVPVQPGTSTATTTTSFIKRTIPFALEGLETIGKFLLARTTRTAFAITTETTTVATSTSMASSTPETSNDEDSDTEESTAATPLSDDVASCRIQGSECHVMEFTGFGVSGALAEKEFHGASVDFSFANISPETARQDGKLQVRYFHNGTWRIGGEVYLNKEISNATNGGYFSSKLEGINSWNDLADLRVVVEYQRGDSRVESRVYLDALWINTTFKDPIQDVLAGNVTNVPDVQQNVAFELAPGEDAVSTLITEDGARTEFPYIDTLVNDSLAVRLDKLSYKAGKDKNPTTVLTSVTNTTAEPGKFKVFVSFPGARGEVQDVSRYMRNVPVATTTPIYHDVTYYCEDGWQPIGVGGRTPSQGSSVSSTTTSTASSTSPFTCRKTSETLACSAVTDGALNCLVPRVLVDTATSTEYVSTWVPAQLSEFPDKDQAVKKALPPGYSIAVSTKDEFELLPGQTAYLKITLATPDTGARRFVLSVKGEKLFGDAHSLRLKDEDSWRLQSKAAKREARKHVNDQVSTKSDFATDELPSFHFKFKTQRGFFTRVKDFLTRTNVPFRVERARLIRTDGEEERVPIDIGYDKNGEWELKLGNRHELSSQVNTRLSCR